ncbi:hypothetical protein [Brevundimonas sp.]|jgi:hypothetical protein|uniref:hypothetical protein n=1 Tax=Brevundimonas sp. TaxID=1871086 RepID=UPI002E0F2C56|nr:hypothetical protein [Brevundimonas sp.]
MKTKDQFATLIAHDVRAMEITIDTLLAQGGALLQNFAEGRRMANLGVRVGQPALVKLTSALASTAEARGHLARAHDLMAATADALSLDYDSPGPFEDKGKEGEKEDPRAALREGSPLDA